MPAGVAWGEDRDASFRVSAPPTAFADGAGEPAAQVLAQAEPVGDPRVTILEPSPGAVFAPGETIEVRVKVDPSIQTGGSTLYGLGSRTAVGRDARYRITIPDFYAGPLDFRPATTDIDGRFYRGPSVVVYVRPTEPPLRLWVDEFELLKLPPESPHRDRIGVKGYYPGGVERTLRHPSTGTTFTSSDPAVVTVDAEGWLTPIGAGSAIVITENRGVRAFTLVDVLEQGVPHPRKDVTDQVRIRAGGFRLNRHNGFFEHLVTISNPGEIPVIGPLFMVVSGLPQGVWLPNKDGVTQYVLPGSGYFIVPHPTTGLTLLPGETVQFKVQYLNPQRQRLAPVFQVFRAINI